MKSEGKENIKEEKENIKEGKENIKERRRKCKVGKRINLAFIYLILFFYK